MPKDAYENVGRADLRLIRDFQYQAKDCDAGHMLTLLKKRAWKLYGNKQVAAEMPAPKEKETQEILAAEIHFISYTWCKYTTLDLSEVLQRYKQRLMMPANPVALLMAHLLERQLSRLCSVTFWQDKEGKWCFIHFRSEPSAGIYQVIIDYIENIDGAFFSLAGSLDHGLLNIDTTKPALSPLQGLSQGISRNRRPYT